MIPELTVVRDLNCGQSSARTLLFFIFTFVISDELRPQVWDEFFYALMELKTHQNVHSQDKRYFFTLTRWLSHDYCKLGLIFLRNFL